MLCSYTAPTVSTSHTIYCDHSVIMTAHAVLECPTKAVSMIMRVAAQAALLSYTWS